MFLHLSRQPGELLNDLLHALQLATMICVEMETVKFAILAQTESANVASPVPMVTFMPD